MLSEFWNALLAHQFLQNAVAGGLLASVACGVTGAYVTAKRMSYAAGGISHGALAGIGIAHYLGASPTGGALLAALFAAALLAGAKLYSREREDTVISALWSVGMAAGILFIAQAPAYHADLLGYLFGNILMLTRADLLWMAGMDAATASAVILLYRRLQTVAFDAEYARLRGLRVEAYYLLFLALISLTVVLLVRIVGLILVIALLTLPAAIAGHYARSLRQIMLAAAGLGMLFTTGGLALSYQPDLPSGPAIIVLAGAAYLLSLLVKKIARPTA